MALNVILLASCVPASPDSLRVERVLVDSAIGQFDPLDRTVTDAQTVQQLHDLVLALPRVTGPESFCPIAWGLHYRLTFAQQGRTTNVVVVEADGCRYAYLSPTDRRWTTESFWAQLAGALGFYTRGHDLFPLPKNRQGP